MIANRGEIACRIIRTAKKLGIKTVAVYSEADALAQHVLQADEAVCIGPAQSSKSYLVHDNIIAAVKKTGAQAIHPGYGFVSENATFIERCEKEGITWIGPPSSAVKAMGDKIESKKLAESAKVNGIPAVLASLDSADEVLKVAHKIGYPVMIKASAGGGGKGMRIAWHDQDAVEGFRMSKIEAKNSFGDDRMFVEKYIQEPRHIEIQVLGDKHGNVLYLPERECSIQRRNQKVVEEAPSTFLDAKTRKAMGEQAVMLAKAVGYTSAGTVEFLVDKDKNFYFLEMNTRLQVEHPITEQITGIDLVEQMIKVASGLKLDIKQEDIKIKGHAIESRVYAEDPMRNFLPSIGTLTYYKEPTGPGVRCDTGVVMGSEIQVHYDPMICKLVTYAPTRDEALDRMLHALDSYVIRGVTHNISLLRAVVQHDRFRTGRTNTKFIPDVWPQGFKGYILTKDESEQTMALTAMIQALVHRRRATITGKLPHFHVPTKQSFVVSVSSKVAGEIAPATEVSVEESENANQFKVTVGGKLFDLESKWTVGEPVINAVVNGTPATLQTISVQSNHYGVQAFGSLYDVQIMTPSVFELSKHMLKKEVIDTSKMIISPMPGVVLNVAVKPGDKVIIGQEICIVEAMKMSNMLHSSADGIVKSVNISVGKNVSDGEVLVELQ